MVETFYGKVEFKSFFARDIIKVGRDFSKELAVPGEPGTNATADGLDVAVPEEQSLDRMVEPTVPNLMRVVVDSGDIYLYDSRGVRNFGIHNKVNPRTKVGGSYTALWVGTSQSDDKSSKSIQPGWVGIRNTAGKDSFILDGGKANFLVADIKGLSCFDFQSNYDNFAALWIGNKTAGKPGYVALRHDTGFDSVVINGGATTQGRNAGAVTLFNNSGAESIVLDGDAGDIFLRNADFAEEFEASGTMGIEPGTVLVIEDEGKLQSSSVAYDKRVAGVVSGAGDLRPGIVLDKKQHSHNRATISLMGKAYCKAEATLCPIEVGDLLTTSNIEGHAMKAADASRAFGAVIGKALRPLARGTGLIPALISLQ